MNFEFLKNIKHEAKFSHFQDEKECPRYVFNCFINGEKFEYSMGIGHAKNGKCRAPKLEEVLHCLFSDYSCASDTFEEFCSYLGYSDDSIKAFETYRACQKSGERLKKALKGEFYTIKEEIEKLDL